MMKIVHLSSVHPPFDTRIFFKQCRSLVRKGHHVTLVVPHTHDEVVDGVHISAVPKPRNRFWRMTVTAAQVVRRALGVRADLYHIHDPELLPWAQLLQLLGKRVIYDMHEHVPKALLGRNWLRPTLRRVVSTAYRWTEPLLMWGVPVVFAEASYERDYRWKRKRAVVQNLPMLESAEHVGAVTKFTTPTVVYIGSMSRARCTDVLLDALQRLRACGVTVEGEMIGPVHDSMLKARIESDRTKGGLDAVQFRGRLVLPEALGIAARCHVGMAAWLPLPNNVGSYPTKMFEYMAVGIPVIVSDLPLLRRVIDDTGCGLCVEPTDAAAVAAAIRWLVEHPTEAHEMGTRGRQAVLSEYSWSKEFPRLLELYGATMA